jgi:antitoxin ParD1/3/4
MPTRNVNLTEHFDDLIETGVSSGRYSNASEVVREGLRLLQERDNLYAAKLENLRTMAKEGFDAIERGEYTELNSREEITAFMDEVFDEAMKGLDADEARG